MGAGWPQRSLGACTEYTAAPGTPLFPGRRDLRLTVPRRGRVNPHACRCARPRGLELRDGRDDLLRQDVELAGLANPEQRAVRLAEAELGHPVQVLDHLVDLLAVLAEVEPGLGGLLDLVVVTALVHAVLAEHVELVGRR